MEKPLDIQADAFDSVASSVGTTPIMGPQQTLGHYLSSRREELELSIEQISHTTKIPPASLLHLESGDFDKLPGDVYVRGFLRSYARCLKLDGDHVVNRYAHCRMNWQRAAAKADGESEPEQEPKPERLRTFVPPRLDYNDEMSHRGPLTLGVIILVIVATLTMSYLLRRPGTSVDPFTMAPALHSEQVDGLLVAPWTPNSWPPHLCVGSKGCHAN